MSQNPVPKDASGFLWEYDKAIYFIDLGTRN